MIDLALWELMDVEVEGGDHEDLCEVLVEDDSSEPWNAFLVSHMLFVV
jgi:hypothetical protein